MKREIAVLAAVVAVGGAAVAVAVAHTTGGPAAPGPPAGAPRSNFSLAEARRFDAFAVYGIGESFEGLPLTAVLRRDDNPFPGEPIRADWVAFVYGDCEAGDDAGCAPPLEVKTWPACRRNPSVYQIPGGADEALTVRGVPARFYERWTRLELSSGDVTIVLYGTGRSQLLRAAAHLRRVNAVDSGAATLPAPARGAMSGDLTCGP